MRSATVGSVNLDFRSLYLHFECGVFFYRSAVVDRVKEDCLNTFACSRADDGRVLQKPAGTGTASGECATPAGTAIIIEKSQVRR